MKSKLAKLAASVVLKNSLLEKAFCYFCSQPNLRESLKLGAIALGCVQVLSYPEIRLANFKKYKMYVNIAEPLGIAAYFFKENRTIWLTSEFNQRGRYLYRCRSKYGTLYITNGIQSGFNREGNFV